MRAPVLVRSVTLGALGAVALLGGERRAIGAEPVRAALDYVVPDGVAGCPSRAELVDAVAARLGYDPFAPRAGAAAPSPRVRWW